jgi:hypothetical protein
MVSHKVKNLLPIFMVTGVPTNNSHLGGRAYGVTWSDGDNLYHFGGTGYAESTTPIPGFLNDLWVYYKTSGLWAYLGGSRLVSDLVPNDYSYGQLGVPNAENWPPRRVGSVSWKTENAFYLFGGQINYNDCKMCFF